MSLTSSLDSENERSSNHHHAKPKPLIAQNVFKMLNGRWRKLPVFVYTGYTAVLKMAKLTFALAEVQTRVAVSFGHYVDLLIPFQGSYIH